MKFHFEKDETRKIENKEKFMNNVLPTFLKRCEKMLADNGGEWFVGSDITWADMNNAVALTIIDEMFKVEVKSPVLAAHQAKVYAMPNIKKYIDNRPKTSF
jgi:glutathione S-transferase